MNQTIGVNITPQSFQPTLHYSQGDVGRTFVINVTDYDIPSGATVTCVATKPSGMGFTVNGTVSGNTVTFTSTAEMTDEWGRFPAEIRIVSGNTLLGTANFLMIGEKNPHPDSTIDGTQEELIPQLTLLVNRVEAAAEFVHDLTVSATTLAAGSDATATYDSANNSIAFGIPRGADGDVTRSEFNDLKADLSDTVKSNGQVLSVSTELFDKDVATLGRALWSDTDEENANYGYTGYIDVSEGNVVIANASGNTNIIVYYDANKTRIPPNGTIKNFDSDNLPSGTVYIRFNFALSTINSVSVTKTINLNCISTEIISDFKEKTIAPNGETATSYVELFNQASATIGRSLYSDTDEANVNYGYTDYIKVSDSDITIANAEDNNNTIVYYDANKTRIPPNGMVKNFDSDNLPSGTVFIRFNFALSTIGSVSVKETVLMNCISTDIISDYPKHTRIYLGAGCQFTTLKAAVEYANSVASQYNIVDIMIKEGVYNIMDDYDLSAQSSSWWGLYVENYVNLIGIGSADKVVINGALPVDISAYAFDRQNISTINLWKNNIVKNMTITAKNIRYCLHNEDGKSEAVDNAQELFENVVFIYYENDTGIITSRVPVGIGASHGRHTKFKNCVFDNRSSHGNYPVLLHNNTTIDTYCEWDFESCNFIGGILNSLKLSSAGSGQTEIVNIKGCKLPKGILFTRESVYSGSNCEYKLFGYGNSIQGGYDFDGVTETASITEMLI